MKLFHISLDTENLEKKFIPCIPECTGYGEDKEIPRICFAPSIEQCIQATHPADYPVGQRFAVFELTVDDDDPYLIYPNELYDKGLVPDALENEEYWLTRPVYLTANILEIEKISSERIFAWTCISFEDVASIIKSISKDFMYEEIIRTSQSPEECYVRTMNYADNIKDYKMIDECYDEIASLHWATKREISYLETKLIYSFEEELVS